MNINDGGLANSVTIYEKENLEFVVTKNGTPIEYKDGTAITEPAEYTVTLTDDIGNKAEFSFTIVEPVVTKFPTAEPLGTIILLITTSPKTLRIKSSPSIKATLITLTTETTHITTATSMPQLTKSTLTATFTTRKFLQPIPMHIVMVAPLQTAKRT